MLPTAEQLTPPTHHTPHQPSQSWPTDETPLPEPLLRIRAYAHVQKRIVLSEGFGRVLSNWNIGEDPSSFEFFMDPEEGVPRYRKDRRKIRKGKERVTGAVGAAGLDVFGASQPPELVAEVFTQAQSQGFGSQALSQSHYTMGQVEKGKHVGRKGGKKRKTGF